MQHDELHSPVLASSLDALWPSVDRDAKHALRLCCTDMRDAVDARRGSLDGPGNAVLSHTTCARLAAVRSLSLRSMACLRGMLVLESPQHPGALFPRLQSLRLILDEGDVAINDAADYQAIASVAPWLTKLSLESPASATALQQQMAALLSACSKLEDQGLYATMYESRLMDIAALAACTWLVRLSLHSCSCLTNLAPLSALVNLQSLDMSHCYIVSDLAPLAALANMRRLDISGCGEVDDLTPLASMVNLQSLVLSCCLNVFN
ncbi:hypothetical protein FOA52_014621 [Chlamydomonas sp. UWO 241]|nr:hypothetical protein FOA52_014621 [Chlamydomonas sp. UWO 241]